MTKEFYPFNQHASNAVDSNQMIPSRVTGLLRFSSPSDISPLVVTSFIVRIAINRVFGRWSVSKFSIKFFKVLKAKLNTASTVRGIRVKFRIVTPTHRLLKSIIFGRDTLLAVPPRRMSVCKTGSPQSFTAETSTRGCVPTKQFTRLEGTSLATITDAVPHSSSLWLRTGIANHQKPSEFLTRNWSDQVFARRVWINNESHTRSIA